MTYELKIYNENKKLIYIFSRGDKKDKEYVIFDLLDKLESMLYLINKDYKIEIIRID